MYSKPSRRVFKPQLVPTLLVLPLMALLIWLSHWQYQRGQEKALLIAQFHHHSELSSELPKDLAKARYSRVKLTGDWDVEHQLLLDNMTHAGQVGYRVWCPVKLADNQWVLVDRGFVAGNPDRQQLPDVSIPESKRGANSGFIGIVDALPQPGVSVTPSHEVGWPRRLNYPTQAELTTVLGHPVAPLLVLLDPTEPDGFVREWRPGGLPPERHYGYAMQWGLLALTLLIGFIYTQFKTVKATD